MASTILTVLATSLLAASQVRAESHTVSFVNNCGKGTPQLIVGGKVVSTGEPYTSDGPLSSAISYLQTGECLFNGEECTLVELNLNNPTTPGSGSSADISLISPHAFNVPAAFWYENGCDNTGTACNSADCSTAFFQPDDTWVQVACEDDNVNFVIAFCDDSGSSSSSSTSTSSSSSSSSSTSSTYSSSSSKPTSTSVTTSTEYHTTTSSSSSSSHLSTESPSTTSSVVASSSSLTSSAAITTPSSSRKTCSAVKSSKKKRDGKKRNPAAEDLSERTYMEAARALAEGHYPHARGHARRNEHARHH